MDRVNTSSTAVLAVVQMDRVQELQLEIDRMARRLEAFRLEISSLNHGADSAVAGARLEYTEPALAQLRITHARVSAEAARTAVQLAAFRCAEPLRKAELPAITAARIAADSVPKASQPDTLAVAASIADPAYLAGHDGDCLTLIRGLDAAAVAKLATVGIDRFADIAALTPEDVYELGLILEDPRRSSHEGWIEQAALLARGIDTAYAKLVRSGALPESVVAPAALVLDTDASTGIEDTEIEIEVELEDETDEIATTGQSDEAPAVEAPAHDEPAAEATPDPETSAAAAATADQPTAPMAEATRPAARRKRGAKRRPTRQAAYAAVRWTSLAASLAIAVAITLEGTGMLGNAAAALGFQSVCLGLLQGDLSTCPALAMTSL